MKASNQEAVHDSASLTILQRAAKKDKEAARECLETYGGLIWALAKKYTASKKEAEAATVEIFSDIWKQSARFHSDKCREIDFIVLIARRRLVKISARKEDGNGKI